MYQGKYLELKWQRDMGMGNEKILKFSKEGSRIAVYSKYDRILSLFDSADGRFLAGN
jgi:hypothetical protein